MRSEITMKRNAFALILGNLCAEGVDVEMEGPKNVSFSGIRGLLSSSHFFLRLLSRPKGESSSRLTFSTCPKSS
ncbi:MAG: hypothetical protein JWM16_3625 [Verrucomicrobiales bacterium]|nr:hypothetical protein [Verrucomicrobiales bacterium]